MRTELRENRQRRAVTHRKESYCLLDLAGLDGIAMRLSSNHFTHRAIQLQTPMPWHFTLRPYSRGLRGTNDYQKNYRLNNR